MEFPTKVNGCKQNVRDLGSKSGLIVPNMLGSGKITKPMDREPSIMLMEMSMKANGSMIKHVAKEHIHIKMEPNTLVSGKTTNRMVME